MICCIRHMLPSSKFPLFLCKKIENAREKGKEQAKRIDMITEFFDMFFLYSSKITKPRQRRLTVLKYSLRLASYLLFDFHYINYKKSALLFTSLYFSNFWPENIRRRVGYPDRISSLRAVVTRR